MAVISSTHNFNGHYNASTITLTDGQEVGQQFDVNGNLKVNIAAGSVGASTADQSTFTAGTTAGTMSMGVYQTTPTTLSNNQAAAIGVDVNRNVKMTEATLLAGEDLTNNWIVVAGKTSTFSFTATSPSSATTTAQTAVTGMGNYRSLAIFATLTGATGGTLDVYLQMSPDGGTTWVDYIHYAQIAAAAGATSKLITVSKLGQQTTITAVGTGTSPALAANTVVGGDWGDRLRVVFVGGAGTTAGASQTILVIGTT